MRFKEGFKELFEKFRDKEEYSTDEGYEEEGSALMDNHYDDYDAGLASSGKILRFSQKESRTHVIIKVKKDDFNAKRKEAANFIKEGHSVFLNLDEANQSSISPSLNFLGGMAFALDGSMKKISNTVYGFFPNGDEIGGDIYSDEINAEYRLDDEF
jgi:cell division inhibitor SepF